MSNIFIFDKYDFDPQTGILALHYQKEAYHFVETITFPNAPLHLSDMTLQALDAIFHLAHIAAGISYYKAFAGADIQINTCALSKPEAAFFNDFYFYGLGQFAYQNNLTLSFDFPYSDKAQEKPFALDLADAAFVPVGGGKDSSVTTELLRLADMPLTLVSINSARPIEDCKKVAHLPQMVILRQISQVLLQNNAHFLNGHVPITGILAFILWAASVIYDKRFVVMSCEKSADEGNFNHVNHQWSKSSQFEQNFYRLTQSITPQFRYFSLLRPFSEMQIAALFAEYCADYFDVFTSCNHAFHIDTQKRLERWCGACDKCRFVFLILAPFIERNKLIDIFGCNPLNDPAQEQGYLELFGLAGFKPFECVGTLSECRLSLIKLSQKPEWKDDFIVKKMIKSIDLSQEETLMRQVFSPSDSPLIEQRFIKCLKIKK